MSIIRDELQRSLLVGPEMLNRIISTAPYRYKVFFIPKKKSGGYRKVAQPAYEVKTLQRWLVSFLKGHLPVHEATVAYRSKRGIRYNASKHLTKKYLLKMDFTDFFPSIVHNDLHRHLKQNCSLELQESDLQDISRIALWQQRQGEPRCLCIGAPSSPFLSNTIPYDLDCAIQSICDKQRITFTRYADDLAFSTNEPGVLRDFERQVSTLVAQALYPRLSINVNKTKHTSRGRGMRLTGVTIANDGRTSIGRERKRQIRSALHYFENNKLEAKEKERLLGWLAFANDIEPSLLSRIKEKHGSDILVRIRMSI